MNLLKKVSAAVGVAAVASVAAVVVAGSPAAATVCKGANNSWDSFGWSYNGAVRAYTTSYDSTCDGDDVFVGYVRDPYTDGYDAKVYITDVGEYIGTFHSTGGSSWSKFTYTDPGRDSSSWLAGYSSSAHLNYILNNEDDMANYGY